MTAASDQTLLLPSFADGFLPVIAGSQLGCRMTRTRTKKRTTMILEHVIATSWGYRRDAAIRPNNVR